MNAAGCLALVLATVATARADKKIQGMTPLFVKEAAACQIELRGLQKIGNGASALADPALETDVAAVLAATKIVEGYCAAVDDMVAFLQTHKDAAYKTVEKDLDARDNGVRARRKEAKKVIAAVAPVTRRLIPKLKRTPAPAPVETKAAPTAFPSKREVVLPALGGTWAVSGTATSDTATHTDKAGTASVTTRRFDKAACEQQRKAFAERSTTPAAELEVLAEAEALGVEWSARLTSQKRSLLAMCAERGMGGVMVIAEIAPGTRRTQDAALATLMVAMLAAQLEDLK